jgi:molybdopterin converting factor small subunit
MEWRAPNSPTACGFPPLPTHLSRANLCGVVQVNLTRHLFAFFPQLEGQLVEVEATDVAGVVRALEARAPGIGFYLCDERGRLRPHVNIFIGATIIRDRRNLSDAVTAGDKVSILQALSGG